MGMGGDMAAGGDMGTGGDIAAGGDIVVNPGGVPEAVYESPSPVDGAPVASDPIPVASDPAPVYEAPAPVYEAPAPVYEAPAPAYGGYAEKSITSPSDDRVLSFMAEVLGQSEEDVVSTMDVSSSGIDFYAFGNFLLAGDIIV